MSRRLLDWRQDAGMAWWWVEDGEGNWAQQAFQVTGPLVDLNREAEAHCSPDNAARDVRMVARIPLIVIAKWLNELGVDYWNPDHQAKVDALNELAGRLGITPADAIAVGDGANDLGMLHLAGSGVALHAKPAVAAEAQIRIDHGDLTALLYLQGYRKTDFVS